MNAAPRPPFERLLLATEHTEFDAGAEAIAFALALGRGGALDAVLPIVSNPEFEAQAPKLAERADAQAAQRADALVAAAAAQGVTLALRLRHGAPPQAEIVAEARARDADLLILRRRGRRSFLANLMLGEMVGEVVAHAPCSVLLCPRAATPWRRAVLVGVDPQAPNAAVVRTAARLAAAAGIGLHVVVVAAAADAAAQPVLDDALAVARGCGATAAGELRHGRAAPQLQAAAAEHGCDLVVVGRHGPVRPERARVGATARSVIGAAAGPVLVVGGQPRR